MAFIYKIINPLKRIYVGSTTRPVKYRWASYKSLSCKNQVKLYRSLKKYGFENHVFEIIEECSIDEMLKLEYKYGMMYNVLDKKIGLNIRLPDKDGVYQPISEETKLKLSKAHLKLSAKRGPHTEEYRLAMSKRLSGENNPRWGKHWSEEAKLNQSNKLKGFKHTKEFAKKVGDRTSLETYQYDLEGNFLQSYRSAYDASLETKTYYSGLREVCLLKRKSAKGYIWRYAKDVLNKNKLEL